MTICPRHPSYRQLQSQNVFVEEGGLGWGRRLGLIVSGWGLGAADSGP